MARSVSPLQCQHPQRIHGALRTENSRCVPSGDHDSGTCSSPSSRTRQPLGGAAINRLPPDRAVTSRLKRHAPAVRGPDRKAALAAKRQSLYLGVARTDRTSRCPTPRPSLRLTASNAAVGRDPRMGIDAWRDLERAGSLRPSPITRPRAVDNCRGRARSDTPSSLSSDDCDLRGAVRSAGCPANADDDRHRRALDRERFHIEGHRVHRSADCVHQMPVSMYRRIRPAVDQDAAAVVRERLRDDRGLVPSVIACALASVKSTVARQAASEAR